MKTRKTDTSLIKFLSVVIPLCIVGFGLEGFSGLIKLGWGGAGVVMFYLIIENYIDNHTTIGKKIGDRENDKK
ncbi:hypothetical protein KKA15_01805 [Patescibacteria group bacterium]|nr:hypothetical protein [Patescibacteria group bacterium]